MSTYDLLTSLYTRDMSDDDASALVDRFLDCGTMYCEPIAFVARKVHQCSFKILMIKNNTSQVRFMHVRRYTDYAFDKTKMRACYYHVEQ